MHAGLGLEPAICVRTRHLQGHRFQAGALALAGLEYLNLVAVLVGPAGIHAHQHLGPVLGLGPALADMQFDETVITVSFAG